MPSSLMARVKAQQQVTRPPPPASTGTSTLAAAAAGGRAPSSTPSHAAAPCRYFREGNCRYGDSCRFSHGDPPQESSSSSTAPTNGKQRKKRWGDSSSWGDESDRSSSEGVSGVGPVQQETAPAPPAATGPASALAEDEAPSFSGRRNESSAGELPSSYAAVVVSSPVNTSILAEHSSNAEEQVAAAAAAAMQQPVTILPEEQPQAAMTTEANTLEEEAPMHNEYVPEQIRNLHMARSNLDEALQSHYVEYQAYIEKLDAAENTLVDRYRTLQLKKDTIASAHGNPVASETDLMEINVGGQIVAVRRGTLCQFKGTRMESLFDGTREKSLRRDRNGRIFLDVGADAFRAIADYLIDLKSHSEAEDAPLDPPDSNDEYDRLVLIELLKVLGIHDRIMSSSGGDEREDDARANADNAISNDLETAVIFAPAINDALNARLDAIKDAESKLLLLENNLVDHEKFVTDFACGDGTKDDVVSLNVGGTKMTTTRSTLRIVEDSILARMSQGSATHFVDGWAPDDVGDWIDAMDNGVPDGTGDTFRAEHITGRELLVLNLEGMMALGIRVGAACLLLDEIRKLRGRSDGEPPFFEHSPYCVGKILDYLRLRRLRSANLVGVEPSPPVVRGSERRRFERTVRFFFSGASAESILGGGTAPCAEDASDQRR